MNPLGSYDSLMEGFLEAGYGIVPLHLLEPGFPLVGLRHDIDFDCGAAHEISLLEDNLGVKSSYFFLVSSEAYNPFSSSNSQIIRDIRSRGHQVSVHFDPRPHTDPREGLAREVRLFEQSFNVEVKLVSIHRPGEDPQTPDLSMEGLEHSYEERYFRDVKYVSDSQGTFRFGHPHEIPEFARREAMHLLTHPIWWVGRGQDPVEILENLVAERDASFRDHVAANCAVYTRKKDAVES